MLGDNIRRERVVRNIKQEYIAQQIGITQGAYSRIEKNESMPSFNRVERIAAVIGCPICALADNHVRCSGRHENQSQGEFSDRR